MYKKGRCYYLTLNKPIKICGQKTNFDYFVYMGKNTWVNGRGDNSIHIIDSDNIKNSMLIKKSKYYDTHPDMQTYIDFAIKFYKEYKFNHQLSSIIGN